MGVYAQVTVTLVIPAKSNWSADTTMAQIHDQAIVDVRGMIERACYGKDAPLRGSTIKGDMLVTHILAVEEKDQRVAGPKEPPHE